MVIDPNRSLDQIASTLRSIDSSLKSIDKTLKRNLGRATFTNHPERNDGDSTDPASGTEFAGPYGSGTEPYST
jgi:hypothetical protein